jgi:Tol biopolymer transport system component
MTGTVALGTVAAGSAPGDLVRAVQTRLAYVTNLQRANADVWVADANGKHARKIGHGVEAHVSPTGDDVAIVTPRGSNGGYALVVRPAGGGPARTLATAKETLAFVSWAGDSIHVVAAVDNRLVVADAETGRARTIARGNVQGASFSPDSTRVAYAISRNQQLSTPVNIRVANIDGTGNHAITHDGRSLFPIWGPSRIAFSHERLRRADAPIYQLWLMNPNGTHRRQLTHTRVPSLVSGLTATQFSGNGKRLLAEYVGQDTSEAWTVDVATGKGRDLTGRVDGVIGEALSADGKTVLVQRGFFDDPLRQSVATIPWAGGRATVLVKHGSAPSWNR